MKLMKLQANSRGFTLIELLIVLAIGGIIATAVGPAISRFPSGSQLDEVAGDLKQVIQLARARSVAGKAGVTHGIFLEMNIGPIPDRYILFRGADYATRNQTYDEPTVIRNSIELTAALTGGATEIVFTPSIGAPSATGAITFTHATGDKRVIQVNDLGFLTTE